MTTTSELIKDKEYIMKKITQPWDSSKQLWYEQLKEEVRILKEIEAEEMKVFEK